MCNFCFSLHSNPDFQYDSKKDLACLWDKSYCTVICTLFTITFLGKWDKRKERPFLSPLTSFPDRKKISAFCPVLSLLLLWTFFVGTLSRPVALPFAVWRMAGATSKRRGGGFCFQYSCLIPFPVWSWYKYLQYVSICLRFVQLQSNFRQLLTEWLNTLHTWLELSSHWFDYLEELPMEFHFEFTASNSTHMPSRCCCLCSLSFLCTSAFSSWYRFFCFFHFPDCCKTLIRNPFLFLLRLDASNRSCSYFKQDCFGTFPEIFWGYLILCSL